MRAVAAVLLAALGASGIAAAAPDDRDDQDEHDDREDRGDHSDRGDRTSPELSRKQRADALAAEGHKLAEASDYAAACAKFGEAISLAPDVVGTMLNLGLCNERLKKYATALSWFRRTRAFSRKHGLTKTEATAALHVSSTQALVATAELSFQGTAPRGAKVTVDDYPLLAADYAHVELDSGHHAIDVTAPKYKPFHVELDIADAESQTVELELEPLDAKARPDPETPEASPDDRKKLVRYLAIGGGSAIVVSGLVALYARTEYLQCVRHGVPVATCASGQDAVATANHYHNVARWGATPLFVAGSAAAGYAAYLYFTTPHAEGTDSPEVPAKHKRGKQRRRGKDSDHDEPVSWVPMIDGSGFGVAAIGSF